MKKQVHVFYSGRVQGVGFRFTVESIAQELGIYGWVKNLRDGRVETLAEADEAVIKQFLDKINDNFSRYIHNADVEWLAATGEFRDFSIAF